MSETRIPPMPEGFTDSTAWDAIHWKPSPDGSTIDQAVIDWQRANQDRVHAAWHAKMKDNPRYWDDGRYPD